MPMRSTTLTRLSAPDFTIASSFAKGGVVTGEIATALGTNLTSAVGINLTSGLPLPTTFLTNSLIVNNQLVALFAVDNVNGRQQINFQVPWEVASGPGLAPGFVGLYQINAEVPPGAEQGDQGVVIEMGGVLSNSVLLPVE